MEKRETGDLSGLSSDRIVRLAGRALAENAAAAIRTLRSIATDPAAPAKHRCRAAEILLNRVYGGAGQPLDETCGLKRGPIVIEFKGELGDMEEESRKPEDTDRSAEGEIRVPPEAPPMTEDKPEDESEAERELAGGAYDAAQTLIGLAGDPKQPAGIRCRAAEAILDRALGRAFRLIAAGEGELDIRFKGVLEEWAG